MSICHQMDSLSDFLESFNAEHLTKIALVLLGKEIENIHKQIRLWSNKQIFRLIQNKGFLPSK